MEKNKEQRFIFKKEEEINQEYYTKIEAFVERLNKLIKEKEYKFHDLVLTYFEIFFRFKRSIPSDIAQIIFNECENPDNFKEFKKLDLIKLSFILSHYYNIEGINKESATEAMKNLVDKIASLELAEFSMNEIEEIVMNLCHREIYPDLVLFTRFEPHILKYLPRYSLSSVIKIFSAYIRTYCGTNFFLQALGYCISAQIDKCSTENLSYLIKLSNPKFYNRSELTIKYTDFFSNIFVYILADINNIPFRDYYFILECMVNLGNIDKKFIQILSTSFIKFESRVDMKSLINCLFLFAKIDLDSEIFWKKAVETIYLNTLCLNNYINGNENMDNLLGIYDRKFVNELNKIVNNNNIEYE
jgi:hypothetical protein